MTAKPRDLPVHSPARRLDMDSAFTRRALGRREARRLAELMEEAERRARARFDAARQEVEQIFADARTEALALLALLPDFAALDAACPAAMRAIRDVADKHELPIAVIVGKDSHPNAAGARLEAVRAVAATCPELGEDEIRPLFSGLSAYSVHRMLVGTRR